MRRDVQKIYTKEEVYTYVSCPKCGVTRGEPCGYRRKIFPWNHIDRTKRYDERTMKAMFMTDMDWS